MNSELKALIDLIKNNKDKDVIDILVLVDQFWIDTKWSILKEEWNVHMDFHQKQAFILTVQDKQSK